MSFSVDASIDRMKHYGIWGDSGSLAEVSICRLAMRAFEFFVAAISRGGLA
jgi:hypothetical protein